MLVEYKIKKGYGNKLCDIFHKSLTNAEFITGKPELIIGDFKIKQLVTTAKYGVWFKNYFIFCLTDTPTHGFTISVHEDSYMTQNMAHISLDCLISAFDKLEVKPKLSIGKNSAVSLIRQIIENSSENFSSDEISEMSELLYGEENQKQLEAF